MKLKESGKGKKFTMKKLREVADETEVAAMKPKWTAKQWSDWLRNVTVIDNRVSIMWDEVPDLMAALEASDGEAVRQKIQALALEHHDGESRLRTEHINAFNLGISQAAQILSSPQAGSDEEKFAKETQRIFDEAQTYKSGDLQEADRSREGAKA